MQKALFYIFLLFACQFTLKAQVETDKKIKVYLIPGQGADYRLFSELDIGDKYDTINISLSTPPKKCDLKNYAKLLLKQIDTTEPFILVGVSIGGMIATEMSELTKPLQTIIISSAKCRQELPHRYRFMKIIPLNQIVPAWLYKAGAQIAQPLIEPDRKHGKPIFKAMLKAKDPKFLKHTAKIIINWNRDTYKENIIHIHGDNDHTLPLRKVKANYIVKGGSHMMVLTKPEKLIGF
jgi:pimeloyl-ACP methyl ester carboxylesterase